MSDIVGRIVKPTAEFIEDLARKLPEALGKGHHRIGQSIHKAADELDKAEDDIAAEAGGMRHTLGGQRAPEDVGGVGGRAASRATEAGEGAGHGVRPGDGDRASIPASEAHCESDPVDVATGDMVLPITDVSLPGALPLVLERTHISSFRHGLWFGPSWASVLDQRLQLDVDGVVLVASDGMRLEYPPPHGDEPVLPLRGPRLPLLWSGVPNEPMQVLDPRSGLTLVFDHPRPAPGYEGAVVLRLVSIRDRNGQHIDIGYSDDDSPALITHHGGYRIAIDRHPELRRITGFRLLDTDGPGTETVLVRYGYDDVGNLTEVYDSSARPLRLSYDGQHRVTGWTDRNGTTYAYLYDETGRVVRTSGSDGFMSGTFEYDDETRTTRFTDSLGNITLHEHNDHYRLVRSTDPLGNVTVQEWSDDNRRLTAVVDPLGHTTRFRYDAADNITAIEYPNGSSTTVANDGGLPVEMTDAAGRVWRTEYDARGNRLVVTDPTGATTRYGYDAHGHLNTFTDALGHTTRIRCDAAGLPIEITDPLGGVSRYDRDAFGRTVAVTDPLNAVTRLSWTVEGLLARQREPDGAEQRWTYDGEGNCLTQTDASGGVTRCEYTRFDLLTARTDPDGARHTFAYDTELRLRKVTNPQGLSWSYDFDAAGRLVAETDFDGGTMSYVHDAAGQPVLRTNALGQQVRYEYDELGRLAAKEAGERRTTYAYDPEGRLLSAIDPDIALLYRYDRLGRVTSASCDGRTITSAYDALGRRTRRVTAAGAVSEWSYDAAGRCDSLMTDGRTVAFDHDAAGRELARHFGDLAHSAAGLTFRQTWDVCGRMTGQTVMAGNREIRRRAYAYRADGNLTGIEDRAGDRSAFDLDAVGRVTAVRAENWSEGYAYDAAGNQTAARWPREHPGGAATGERAYRGTRLTRAGRTYYEHDAQGRIVVRRRTLLSGKPHVWRYEWDAEDRLVRLTTPDGQLWRYVYDPLGRRIAKERLAQDGCTVLERTAFTWDGATLAEQTTTAPSLPHSVTLTWDHDGLLPLAQTERIGEPGLSQAEVDQRFFVIVTDLVGTPTELIGEDGETAWISRATLWGTTAWSTTSTAYTPLRFPGQYYDPESGLHYNVHRYYEPETARYVSQDPLGLGPAPNPVTYVDNPHGWVDPLGLSPCGPDVGVPGRALQFRGPKRVFRGDTRGPEGVFSGGFTAKPGDATLKDYVWYKKAANVVSTSTRRSVAAGFSLDKKAGVYNGWVYEIHKPGPGIDVNATLGRKYSVFSAEHEIAYPGSIPGNVVYRARPYTYGVPSGPWEYNPNFTG